MPERARQHHGRAILPLAVACALVLMPLAAFAVSGVDAAKAATVAISDSDLGIYGSGVVIAPEWVLTAAHVAEGAQDEGLDTTVMVESGAEFDGEIESISRDSDLALLHVAGLSAPSIVWGTAGSLSSGDEVYAVGYPLGMEAMSVTKGIVSAPSQAVQGSMYVQTDASINPGNSGGPLVDVSGRLIGINVMKNVQSTVDNVGFAVPLEQMETFLKSTTVGFPLPGAIAGPTGAATTTGGGGGTASDSGGFLLVALLAIGGGLVAAVVLTSRGARPVGAVQVGSAIPLGATPRSSGPPAADPAPSRAPDVRLSVQTEGSASITVEAMLPAVIGRDGTADIRVSDSQVSRHHARMTVGVDGVVVHDLSSRNGVQFQGRQESSFTLPVGETFQVGRTTVRRIS